MINIPKIKEIVEAWAISIHPNTEQKNRAILRYTVCKMCEYNKPTPVFGESCSLCGCPLDKKIFSTRKGACDIGKWDKIDKK